MTMHIRHHTEAAHARATTRIPVQANIPDCHTCEADYSKLLQDDLAIRKITAKMETKPNLRMKILNQMQVLLYLRDQARVASEVADHCGSSHQWAHCALMSLEKMGLVKSKKPKKKNGAWLWSLTKRARGATP